MTDRYTATIDASGSTVTADIDENDDVEGGRAGALLLYYDGPETGRGLPEKVGERHFYDAEGAGDADGGQVNLDNGATVDFDVPQTYVAGDGVWTLHHDADDTPIARVIAAEARGEDNDETVPATEVRRLREQLAKERDRNERQDEAIAELRSELDTLEDEADVQVDDGGGVARLILNRLSG